MTPLIHFITTLLICVPFYFVFGSQIWIIFVTGIFIDLDHIHIHFKKLTTLKGIYDIVTKLKCEGIVRIFCLFHTIEFLILISILSFYSKIFLLMLIAMIPHLIIDYTYELIRFKRIIKYPSVILYLTSRNNKTTPRN